MKRHLIKGYLKQRIPGTIISVVFFVVLYFVVKDKLAVIFFAAISLFDFVKGFFSYKRKQEYLTELAAQGLTEQQAEDRSFVIKWEKIKNRGMLKYCFVDGGIMMGFGLALFIGIVTFFILLSFFGTPIDEAQFIEFCCLLGIFSGIVLGFLTWSLNDKKFTRLTKPLH